jgi:uncharacterized YigZ family protein
MQYTLSSPVHSDLLIKKSRFLGCVQPVVDRETAKKIVAALWAEHPNAAHVCWALLAGGQSAAVDDGEPSGTAGRPMLEVLRHQGLEGVLATVVRYFGGVKLGAGGLVGAYTDCIAQALKTADKVPLIQTKTLCCQVPYALEGLVRRVVDELGAVLVDVQHGSVVRFQLSVREDSASVLVERLNERGQGRIVWEGVKA